MLNASASRRSAWRIQQSVVFALFMRELKTRFGGRLIGLFWVLLEPVASIYVMLFIRDVLRVRLIGPTIQYPVYLVCAMVPYYVFRNCWARAMEAVGANGGLFAYRQVKPLDAVLARVVLEVYVYFWVFVCVMGTLAWFGFRFLPDDPLLFIYCVAVQVLLGLGAGEVSLVLTHGRPNAKLIVRLISTPLYLMSGILIPLNGFPPEVLRLLMFNPCASLAEVERVAYFHEYLPVAGTDLGYASLFALALCAWGRLLHHRHRDRLSRR